MSQRPTRIEQARRRRPAERRIVLVAYDGVQSLDVTGPYEVFATANTVLAAGRSRDTPCYRVEIAAPRAGLVRAGSGLALEADSAVGALRGAVDTVLVAGGDARSLMEDTRTKQWLVRMMPRVRRMGSICTGAFVLAAAGLLDGRRATTHWRWVEALRREFPSVDVEADALFVRDGKLVTSAGVTAGIDLALALVEEDHGSEVALAVARGLVVFLKRPGGQSQFSAALAAQSAEHGPLGDLLGWIAAHPEADLSVEALAARSAMSARNFARVFVRETGTTPAKFVERVRVEAARRILEESADGLEAIAGRCGFSSGEHLRRTFHRHLGVVPQDYRRRFQRPRAGTVAIGF